MAEFLYTMKAVFDAVDEDDGWDQWIEWLSEPAHIEDGTTVRLVADS